MESVKFLQPYIINPVFQSIIGYVMTLTSILNKDRISQNIITIFQNHFFNSPVYSGIFQDVPPVIIPAIDDM